eukprot:5528140-Amphidinium_carterae.1
MMHTESRTPNSNKNYSMMSSTAILLCDRTVDAYGLFVGVPTSHILCNGLQNNVALCASDV